MPRVLILLTAIALLGSAAAAEQCTIDTMRQAMEAWDRTEDTVERQAIAEALNVLCLDERGIPRVTSAERDPSQKIQCAACGLLRNWDDRLKVWRPHRN
jgi:hypothetical protein